MRMYCFILLAVLTVAGCSKEKAEEIVIEPVEEVRVEIGPGETYEEVIQKLGRPNIDSTTEQSRILIYDDMELKLQSNIVVEVFDHRPE